MSYANFIPNVYIAEIFKELRRRCVFVDGTYQKYEGKVKRLGESVTFTGIGKPTAHTIGRKDRYGDISSAEVLADSSIVMTINKLTYVNYEISDIDEQQSIAQIHSAANDEKTEVFANELDKCVSDLAKGTDVKHLLTSSGNAYEISSSNVLDVIDAAIEKLYENDVARDTYVEIIIPPFFYTALKKAYVSLDTDNSKMLLNGKVGRYGNIVVKMSNNVAVDGSGNSYVQVRTKRAIGFAKPFAKAEAYRPQGKLFVDAVKAGILYDAKIIRPNELVVIKCKKA